jgi:hypothetical protein
MEIDILDDLSLNLKSPIENTTGLEKNITIKLNKDKPSVFIHHKIYNRNLWDISYSVWALTAMKEGGITIIPFPPKKEHNMNNLLPVSSITLWPYTNLSDDRFTFGKKYLLINQKSESTSPQKIGIYNTEGWFAYHINNKLFIKKFNINTNSNYPDFNSSNEFFTNREMMELESLTPINTVQPNDYLENIEEWFLYEDVPKPTNENDIDVLVSKYIRNN